MIVKQADLRSNLKKYFDMALDEEPVFVPRKDDRNVVILSEKEYRKLMQAARLAAYSDTFSGSVFRMPEETSGAESILPMIKNYTECTDIRTDNMDRISIFEHLGDNWNGNGAKAFERKLIERVREIVGDLEIQPEIFPSAAGTIELEYGNSRRDFMGISIGSDDKAEVFIVMYNSEEIFETIDATANAINERVKKFYE